MLVNVGSILTVLVLTLRSGVEGISSYHIEDAHFDKLNPEYVDVNNSYVHPVWWNSTHSGLSINITVLKAIPQRAMGHLNVFEKLNRGYKSPPELSISQPWCKVIKDPYLILSFARAMNFTGCPTMPGTYAAPGLYQPPPMAYSFPGTQYKTSMVARNKNTIFFHMIVYVSLY